MLGLQFINFNDYYNHWKLDTVIEITTAIKEYTKRHNLKDVILYNVEDQTSEEPQNQRYNIIIRYENEEKDLLEQRLIMIKGTVYNCQEFHELRRKKNSHYYN